MARGGFVIERRILLALAFVAAPSVLGAQSTADTTAVLELVGRSYRASVDGGIAIRLAGPVGGEPATIASLGARYARMAATGGMMPLLSQLPEATCDSAVMDPTSGVMRPWLSSTMHLRSVQFAGDTATVVGDQEFGEHPCWENRELREQSYRLVREPAGWVVKESWVSVYY